LADLLAAFVLVLLAAGATRAVTFGITRTGKMVTVSHTRRGDSMRIISARLMEKHERGICEQD